jgi:hypothetical protein
MSDGSSDGAVRLETMLTLAFDDLVRSGRPSIGSITFKRLADDPNGSPRWWAVSLGTNMSSAPSRVRVEGRVTPDMVIPAVIGMVESYTTDPRRAGRVWPPCRGHDHAMQLVAIGDEGAWTCPLDSELRFRIGHLPNS